MKKPVTRVEIQWRKQPRQIEFLRACGLSFPFEGGGPRPPVARILLYGGSAGSGKSDALLIVGFIACVTWPKCNVVYFRREYPDLEGPGGAIPRSKELFSQIGKWHGGQRRWTFPGGGILEFSHCKREDDVYGFQSQQFDVLLIDESTQFTEFQLNYLLTRNRATVDGIIPFCAMATNPGGVSHGYHKKRFVDAGPWGLPVDVEVEGKIERHIFIPARLSDNKVLEERDPGYRSTLERQPEEIRRALLDGDWNVFAGQYFKTFRREKDGKPYHVIPPEEIPREWRRFASIDWGFKAPCAVLWHAIDPAMGRVKTYRELYVTEHRAAEVAELFVELSKYKDGTPEDIAYVKMSPDAWAERGLGSKAQPGEVVAEEFIKRQINVEPADNRRVLGWNRMREYMAEAPDGLPWWQVFETCPNLIRTLPEMIHDKRHVEDIDKDGEDHACFVAGTMVETSKGEVPIEKVREGQEVLTRKGYRRVLKSQCTGIKPVYRVMLSTGRELIGTANHPVWVKGKGFISLGEIELQDELLPKGECKWNQKALFSMELHSEDTPNRKTGVIDFTTDQMADLSSRALDIFIRRYGRVFTEKYRRATTFTTKMRIRLTTTLKILNVFLGLIIYRITAKRLGLIAKTENSGLNTLSAYAPWRRHGMERQRGENLAEKMALSYGRTYPSTKGFVTNAAMNTKRGTLLQGKTTFVPISVSQPSEEKTALMMSKESALFAAGSLQPTNTAKGELVQESAVQVLGICPAGTEKVYNISVEGEPEYFANGVLVHNCESLRYGLMSRPSPNEGESFLPGAAEHYKGDSPEPEEDDELDDMMEGEEVPSFYAI